MACLRDLLSDTVVVSHRGPLDLEVKRIITDSREVRPGDVFVCLPGYRAEAGETRADRHDFIPMALANGAQALVVQREIDPPGDVTVVRVRDCWLAAAEMACRFYEDPSARMLVVGVTGTSGKTSTTYFLDALLRTAGHRVARLGTIEYNLNGLIRPAAQTTPEAPLLQALLREAVDRDCTAVVMEVSSHALELGRVHRVSFDFGVFTNLSQDHLNFHSDMDSYRRAKGRLFESLSAYSKSGVAVVNVDDSAGAYMIDLHAGRTITYGIRESADVSATDVETNLKGLSMTVRSPSGKMTVRLRHLGVYSAYNALAAIAVGHGLGLSLPVIERGIEETSAVPGRFELIDEGQDFVVAVDYAHKPDALARLLDSARELRPRRIITVFGCGGDRDRGKRPVMGRIAAQKSDFVIVTSDNPRSEDPDAIIAAIVAGVHSVDPGARRYRVQPDRAAAIREAISMAGAGDIVIIAGKGHETAQLIGGKRLHFDDREQARTALRGR